MAVPFIDITREIKLDLSSYEEAAHRVICSGTFLLGPEVAQFEEDFAKTLHVKHVIAVSNGTLALYASLLALDIGHGDEVIVPTNSFIATAEAVVMTGARPVFCDVDPTTYHVSLAQAERLCTPKTKAIIPVHLYGRIMEMGPLQEIATRKNLRIIEDACQAHGASMDGKYAGTIGDVGCFSFYPTKNLGALGEGGAVVTNSDELAERLRGVRVHGSLREKYRHDFFGSNLRMEALQGAFLSIKLKRLQAGNERRQEIADRYRDGLQGLPLVLPPALPKDQHVYHLFVIQVSDRGALQTRLEAKGIHTAIHYPIPIHLQPAMAAYSEGVGSCPEAEKLSEVILSLPLFSMMMDEEISQVIQAVREHYGV